MAEEKTEITQNSVEKPEVDYKAEWEKAQAEIERYKNAISKTNTEISKVKKDLADRLTAEEAAELKRKEENERMEQELAEYKKRDRINTYKSKLIEGGYDAESALIMATALPEGVADTYFDTMKKHHEGEVERARKERLSDQPKTTVGAVPGIDDPELNILLRGAGLIQ